MVMTQVDTGQWLTLQEVSRITGRSINSLRLLIRRRKLSQVLKVKGKHGDEWKIHRDAVHDLGQCDQSVTQVNDNGVQDDSGDMTQVITLPVEVFLQQQKERDEMAHGLMMYRYKYEELDRQVRMLPAPVEVVNNELKAKDAALKQKDEALARAQEILKKAKESYDQYKVSMSELKAQLAEEERAREAYRIQWELAQAELKKPWWRKLFGVR
jgi:hypothetical protein